MEIYNPGDLVKKSDFYEENYPMWKECKGVIVSSKMRMINSKDIGLQFLSMYKRRYGNESSFPLWEIIITCPDGNYSVSQFGIDKII